MDRPPQITQRPRRNRARRTPRRRPGLAALALAAGLLPAGGGASSAEPLNLIDLIRLSDRILSGTVVRVLSGQSADDAATTEVTLRVAESLLGAGVDEYTFRQNGRAEQEGRPTWTPGERVIVFLARPVTASGLQTTVGPLQGKLLLREGRLSGARHHQGLFAGVAIDASGLSLDQVAMLEGGTDVVDAEAFLALVRRAVREDWIAKGVMRRVGEAPSNRPLRRAASQSKKAGELRDGSP